MKDPKNKSKATVKGIKYESCPPPLFKELVREAQQVWDECASDWLELYEERQCSAADARECVGDRMRNPKWWKLARYDQEAILAEAIQRDQCM